MVCLAGYRILDRKSVFSENSEGIVPLFSTEKFCHSHSWSSVYGSFFHCFVIGAMQVCNDVLCQGLSVLCTWIWVDSLSQLWEISLIMYFLCFLCSPFWNSLSFKIRVPQQFLEFCPPSPSLYLSIHLPLSLSLVIFSWRFHQLCLMVGLLDKIQDTQVNVNFRLSIDGTYLH